MGDFMDGALQQPAPKQADSRENPLLTTIAQEAEAKVPEELKSQFLSIMVAGGKIMWSPEMTAERQMFDQSLKGLNDVPRVVAHTVLKIVSIIQNESQSKKPLAAIGLAAPIFMAHVLQYVEGKHKIQITRDVIDKTGQMVGVNLMKMYGVTEAHLQELIRQRSSGQGAAPQQGQPNPAGQPTPEARTTPETEEV